MIPRYFMQINFKWRAHNKNNPSLLIDSKLKAVFIMLSAGMFKETFDSLNAISITDAIDSVKGRVLYLNGDCLLQSCGF
ncbi:MAG: hypothetical protein WKG06_27805 [Segetibacter sp.]